MSDSNGAQWTYMCDQLLGVQFSQMYITKLAESMTGPVISETVHRAASFMILGQLPETGYAMSRPTGGSGIVEFK
jgi:hypothetical protein